ncbi:hypothetical protein FRUB_07088 [Fimbriiglobus ruber]|uniref:Polyketide cyclase / dehydrase and lipid transport n=1 Tax=Fimbriiglobus ruber TaxID=1908690 RepID=A0A225DHD6_9BACT|nr:hypothetical protein FRUB_07088 [Fimbriiglobus ruber]
MTNPERVRECVTAIKAFEVIPPGPVAVGTKIRETRIMFGREATETFEVAECDPPSKYTLTAISCGAQYRVEHRFVPDGAGTRFEIEMTIAGASFFAKLMSPLARLMMRPMKKAIAGDMAAIASAAEKAAPQ